MKSESRGVFGSARGQGADWSAVSLHSARVDSEHKSCTWTNGHYMQSATFSHPYLRHLGFVFHKYKVNFQTQCPLVEYPEGHTLFNSMQLF